MPVSFHCILALAILLLDLSTGPLRSRLAFLPASPVLLARVALSLSRRLNRSNRSSRTLRMRGAMLVVLLGGGAVAAGAGLGYLASLLPFPYRLGLEGILLWGCIRASLPLARLRAATRQIGGEADQTRFGSRILEQTASSFVHFIASPLFWFLLAGVPGAFTASAAWAIERAARESGAGGSGSRGQAFGGPAATFGRIVSWIPCRITELILVVAAALVPSGKPAAAFAQGWGSLRLLGDRSTAAAFAGGLGVALPGPPRATAPRIWIGTGRTRIGRSDLARATWLYMISLIVAAGLIALAALLSQG